MHFDTLSHLFIKSVKKKTKNTLNEKEKCQNVQTSNQKNINNKLACNNVYKEDEKHTNSGRLAVTSTYNFMILDQMDDN